MNRLKSDARLGCSVAPEPVEIPSHRLVQGVRVPSFVYGTAWKEEETARLTRLALSCGFRGIDTANQRRHYFEAAVGEAVRDAIASGMPRSDLFLQTKFTFVGGQDHRLPYDPRAPVARQVAQSFERSLEHLGVEHIDSLVLHGPSTQPGLAEADWDAWGAMEDLQRSGATRLVGVSNVNAAQLQELWQRARVRPSIVQNRTFTRPASDQDVRSFCKANGIVYQGFSLLTAIRPALRHPSLVEAAEELGVGPEQAVFAYCLADGMVALTGTSSGDHMRMDLAVQRLRPPEAWVARMRALLG